MGEGLGEGLELIEMNVVRCAERGSRDGQWSIGEDDVEGIARVLEGAGLIVYPTETLYALGADPMNREAINRLLEAKGRPNGMPISIALADIDVASRVAVLDEMARSLIRKFMPGPLTVVARAREDAGLHDSVTNEGKVGIRIPDHPIPLTLARRFGPLTATSANRHGGKDPTDISIAREQLGDDVEIYIDCGTCRLGVPSTVIDVSEGDVKVIREGAITREMLDG